MRALQLRPDIFRAAVAIDAPLDPEAWLRSTVNLDAETIGEPTFAQQVRRTYPEFVS